MKTLKLNRFGLLVVIAFVALFAACDSNDDDNTNPESPKTVSSAQYMYALGLNQEAYNLADYTLTLTDGEGNEVTEKVVITDWSGATENTIKMWMSAIYSPQTLPHTYKAQLAYTLKSDYTVKDSYNIAFASTTGAVPVYSDGAFEKINLTVTTTASNVRHDRLTDLLNNRMKSNSATYLISVNDTNSDVTVSKVIE